MNKAPVNFEWIAQRKWREKRNLANKTDYEENERLDWNEETLSG